MNTISIKGRASPLFNFGFRFVSWKPSLGRVCLLQEEPRGAPRPGICGVETVEGPGEEELSKIEVLKLGDRGSEVWYLGNLNLNQICPEFYIQCFYIFSYSIPSHPLPSPPDTIKL